MLFLVASREGHAWETDQLTDRAVPLPDATDVANAMVNELLDEAIADANAALRCRAPASRTHRAIARRVRALTSRDERVPGRGLLKALGYGRYSAWLETAPLPRREFVDRSDVFGGIPSGRAPILSLAGTSSTVRLAGVLLGTDKPDHFFETGWRYWRRARHGTPARAVRWGTWTENTLLGLHTSSGFSYGDLFANWQGYRFYADLLHPERGHVAVDAEGCLVRTRDFDWAEWVDWRWDELLNPTVYTRKVRAWLGEKLADHRERYCARAGTWSDEVLAHLPVALAEDGTTVDWAGRRAPPRQDPFDIAALCGVGHVEAPLDEVPLDEAPEVPTEDERRADGSSAR